MYSLSDCQYGQPIPPVSLRPLISMVAHASLKVTVPKFGKG